MSFVDIFPSVETKELVKLEYPEKNFQYVPNNTTLYAFVLYMTSQNIIYYKRVDHNKEKFHKHLLFVGKEAKEFHRDSIDPFAINWLSIATRYKRPVIEFQRSNVDIRAGYKFDQNKFLVKGFFTFGQRTVEMGTAHVIQTLNVPLLFYIMDQTSVKIQMKRTPRLFPCDELHLYDRSVLGPNEIFRIPSGTTYLIFAPQKTFFSLDIVNENLHFKVPFIDPLLNRKTSLFYELPPPRTPYIEEQSSNEIMVQQFFQPCIQDTAQQFFPPQHFIQETAEQFIQETTEQFIQPQIILEENQYFYEPKKIKIVAPNFIEHYQSLKYREMPDPRCYILQNSSYENSPLDLSMGKNFDELITTDKIVENTKLEELVKALEQSCSEYDI